MIKFLKDIISSNSKASHKRFIALQSFYLLIVITIISLIHRDYKLQNTEILLQIENHLFYIVMTGFFVTGSENIVKLITTKSTTEEINNGNNQQV